MFKIILILFILFFSTSAFSVQSATATCNSSPCGNSLYGDKVLYGTINSYSRYDSICADYRRNDGTVLGGSMVQHNATWDKCLDNNGNPAFYVIRQANSCPSNSTATSPYVCTCTSPYVDSPDSRSCVSPPAPCTAGSTVSTGYYDLGTDPSASPNVSTCSGGCGATYEGSGAQARRLVDGVYHYFSTGSYVSTAESCSSGNDTSSSNQTLPTDECGSNQVKVTMGSKSKCYNNDGSSTNPNSASAVAAANTANDVAAQSAISAAQDMESNAGITPGSGASGAGSVAAGNIAANDHESGKDDVMRNFCKDNPESKICIDQDFGEVSDETLENKDINVSISPVNIGSAGVCPAPTPFTIAGRTGTFSWTIYCNFATGIKPILLVFAWLSAAGILIGGFKT